MRFLTFLLALALHLPAWAAQEGLNAGVRLFEFNDPVSGRPARAAVFFPTHDAAQDMNVGPLEIKAKKDAALEPGRHPLLLLSHGSGGSLFGHHDIATFLARHGYFVAAIEHPGDNFRDESGLGSDRVLVGRNLQLSALLDALLGHSSYGARIDAGRIGVAGFSAGGYTVLLMIGARPDFSQLKPYCARNPQSVLCSGGGKVNISSPPLIPRPDLRVRAAFVMNPVAAYFSAKELSSISRPVAIWASEADAILPVGENARWLRDHLPVPAKYEEIPKAGHFVFLAPCNAAMEISSPALCIDPPGVDRAAVHDALRHAMVDFFDKHLATNP